LKIFQFFKNLPKQQQIFVAMVETNRRMETTCEHIVKRMASCAVSATAQQRSRFLPQIHFFGFFIV
jgi:hypothetical protein